MDDFPPQAWLDPLIAEFPMPRSGNWQTFDNGDALDFVSGTPRRNADAGARAAQLEIDRQEIHSADCDGFLEFPASIR